jgi:arsenite methyltransferase
VWSRWRPSDRVLEIGFLPREHMDRMNMPTDIFTARAPEDVIATLKAAGFRNGRAERPDPSTPWNVIVAERWGLRPRRRS